MDTNLSLDKEIAILELESKIEGHQLKRKQIVIEKMRITRRIADLEEAIVGVDASIAEAQQQLADEKAKE
jgi:hypothetical protein